LGIKFRAWSIDGNCGALELQMILESACAELIGSLCSFLGFLANFLFTQWQKEKRKLVFT
jgi:hypothetical protein